jgi:hypothetical protein
MENLWITLFGAPRSARGFDSRTGRKCPPVAIFRPFTRISRVVIHIFEIYPVFAPADPEKRRILSYTQLQVEAVLSMKKPGLSGAVAS